MVLRVILRKEKLILRNFSCHVFFKSFWCVRLKKTPVTCNVALKNKGFNPGIAGFKCPKPITFKGVAAIETLSGMVKNETLKRNHERHPNRAAFLVGFF